MSQCADGGRAGPVRVLDTESLVCATSAVGPVAHSMPRPRGRSGGLRSARSETDYVFPTYRELTAAMARGIGLADLLRQWQCSSHCGQDPREVCFNIFSLVLGTQTLHATGYAWASTETEQTRWSCATSLTFVLPEQPLGDPKTPGSCRRDLR